MRLKERIRKMFCLHKDNEVICWHYYHHPNYGYWTKVIEAQVRCKKCGKYRIQWLYPGAFDLFEEKYKDKYWSDMINVD